MSIYLDYNATAPLKAEVREAMMALPLLPYNPSSLHRFGREARKRVEEARARLLTYVEGEGYRLVFTGSGTEANNLALKGLQGYKVMASAIEHVSVLKSCEQAEIIPVDSQGVVDMVMLESMLAHETAPTLVSVMLANNETGVIQPVAEITALAHHYGALVHCDAVQGLGKIMVDMAALRLDMLTVSAHKCGGPQGIGALILRRNLHLAATLTGGGQEQGFRAGTENVAAIIGFAAALPAREQQKHEQERLAKLQWKLEKALEGKAVIFGHTAPRIPGTSLIAMPGVSSETQLIAFDLHGIALSSGSACSSGRVTVSHVLLAMGVAPELAGSVVRVSMGAGTTEDEIEKFIGIWMMLYEKRT